MNNCNLIINWNHRDQVFVVDVPALPGCRAKGATYQEAVANAEVVITEWMEKAHKLGRQAMVLEWRVAPEPIPIPEDDFGDLDDLDIPLTRDEAADVLDELVRRIDANTDPVVMTRFLIDQAPLYRVAARLLLEP